jgi:hypothetical protein
VFRLVGVLSSLRGSVLRRRAWIRCLGRGRVAVGDGVGVGACQFEHDPQQQIGPAGQGGRDRLGDQRDELVGCRSGAAARRSEIGCHGEKC